VKRNPIRDYVEIYDYSCDFCKTPSPKFYKSQEFDNRLQTIIGSCFPENQTNCLVLKPLFDKLGARLYLHGGGVRDIINGITINDVDILFNFETAEPVLKICKELNIHCLKVIENLDDNYVHIKFTEYLEGRTITPVSLDTIENDVNALIYDFTNKVIIDPNGTGFENNLKMQFRIVKPTFNNWFSSKNKQYHGWKLWPLRLIKMFEKGYVMEDYGGKNMHTFRKWLQSKLYTLKMNKLYPNLNCPILPWFVFSRLRGDTINRETCKIEKIGTGVDKLKKYLDELRRFDYLIYVDVMKNLELYDSNIMGHRQMR